ADRRMGGLPCSVVGWVADHVGREAAIFLAFALEGISLLLLFQFRHDPALFVLTSGLAFFGWGAVFSLFPAVSGDMFGRTFATTNYGWLYTAKGAASLLVALCNRLHAGTGSWGLVFALLIAADWLAALLALLVLRPLRARLSAAEFGTAKQVILPVDYDAATQRFGEAFQQPSGGAEAVVSAEYGQH